MYLLNTLMRRASRRSSTTGRHRLNRRVFRCWDVPAHSFGAQFWRLTWPSSFGASRVFRCWDVPAGCSTLVPRCRCCYISVDEEDAGASLPLLHALNARAGRALRSGRRSADAPLDRVQCPHPTVCDSEK